MNWGMAVLWEQVLVTLAPSTEKKKSSWACQGAFHCCLIFSKHKIEIIIIIANHDIANHQQQNTAKGARSKVGQGQKPEAQTRAGPKGAQFAW